MNPRRIQNRVRSLESQVRKLTGIIENNTDDKDARYNAMVFQARETELEWLRKGVVMAVSIPPKHLWIGGSEK